MAVVNWSEGMDTEMRQGLQALMNWIGTSLGEDSGVLMHGLMLAIMTWQGVRKGQVVTDSDLCVALGNVEVLCGGCSEVGLKREAVALERLYITLEAELRGGEIYE